MGVSVVIPTYNRGAKLRDTVRLILESDLTSINDLEVIVVDDGSREPAEQFITDLTKPANVALRAIRQANSGPAAARNHGAQDSRGEIVLFIDDDIFVPPDLISNHVKAHLERPGAVVFGRCPF